MGRAFTSFPPSGRLVRCGPVCWFSCHEGQGQKERKVGRQNCVIFILCIQYFDKRINYYSSRVSIFKQLPSHH